MVNSIRKAFGAMREKVLAKYPIISYLKLKSKLEGAMCCLRRVQDSPCKFKTNTTWRLRILEPTRARRAEGTGFEPVKGVSPRVFKTRAIGRYANPPNLLVF